MLNIIIYTHSDYFDILPIQLAYFKRNVQGAHVSVLTDKPYPECEYPQIIYDPTLPYAGRLLSGLKGVSVDYIILIHENDILCRFNMVFIQELIETMNRCRIDVIDLKHDFHGTDKIYVSDDVSLVKKWTYYYCVQPSLWRVTALREILTQFPEKTYRNIEEEDLQKYVAERYNTRSLNSTKPVQSMWYKLAPQFCYIHMTSRLLLLPCIRKNGLESFLQEEHEKIFADFLNDSQRDMQDSIYSYDNTMVANCRSDTI